MCGIGGVFAKNSSSYGEMLPIIIGIGRNVRHRGKDNSGMGSFDLRYETPTISRIRSSYPIDTVFQTTQTDLYENVNPSLHKHLNNLSGPASLIHTRFTTKGGYESISNCQPIVCYCKDKHLEVLNGGENGALFHYDVIPPKSENSIMIAHNGQVPKERIDHMILDAGYGCDHKSVTSDSGSLAAYILMEATEKGLEEAIKSLFKNVPGSYSLLGMISIDGGFEAFATKDRYGVRPLERAEHKVNSSEYIAYASENAAFKRLGIKTYSEVKAGTVDILRYDENESLKFENIHIADPIPRECAFEVIYNMAPESEIECYLRLFDNDFIPVARGEKTLEEYRNAKPNIANRVHRFAVSTVRERIGELFHRVYGNKVKHHDILCAIPNSGSSYADGYGRESCENPAEVIFVNREKENERSFQNPTGEKSKKAIQEKLLFRPIVHCLGAHEIYSELIQENNADYGVFAIDDSVVTGTASTEAVKRLKMPSKEGGSGAKEVHLGVIVPPICEACYLGIDMKSDRNIVVSVGRENGIKNPKQWALDNPYEFELRAAKYIGADSMVFSRITFMKAIFPENIYGFACVGGPDCAPFE